MPAVGRQRPSAAAPIIRNESNHTGPPRAFRVGSEAALWSALKARQLGVSFRRQAPVAALFIPDSLAPSIKLIVEVDGAIHTRKQGADARRDRKLRRAGFRSTTTSPSRTPSVSRSASRSGEAASTV